ncbi:MAG: SDR family NAD(P)-dependent oxidoreductase [Nitrospirae bacterium]|nr:SDR family NAD(P)-dependent oxidoreductase [Nitrospirota bacterium]
MADEIRTKYGSSSLILPADVRKPAEITRRISEIWDRYGRIDYLVNSAGIISYKPFLELSFDELQAMMDVNYWGTVACIQSVLPFMIRQGAGHIVNIASTAGRRGFPMETGYCASKFAVIGFSEALRLELQGTGVGISIISPGIVDTPMAAGFLNLPGIRDEVRPISADEIASRLMRAIAEKQVEVILPLTTRLLIRLNGVAPRWADWLIRRRVKRINALIQPRSLHE